MNSWKKGIFNNTESLNPNALYTAKFIGAEEFETDAIPKVRFSYTVVDDNGEYHNVNRSFSVKDKQFIRKWLQAHSSFDTTDPEMRRMKDSKHLVTIAYYKDYAFIQKVYPMDGDLHVDA